MPRGGWGQYMADHDLNPEGETPMPDIYADQEDPDDGWEDDDDWEGDDL